MARQVKPEWKSTIYDFLKDPTMYFSVKPIAGALDAVERIRKEGHNILFVTSCVVGSTDAKMQWLIRNDFVKSKDQCENEFVAARQKHRVNADVLIDDRIDNVEKYPGLAFLVTRPHNALLKTTRQRIGGVHEALETTYRAMGMRMAA